MAQELDQFLEHHGVKGMKWGKHQTKADYKSAVSSNRKEIYKNLGNTWKSDKRQAGAAIASNLLLSPATGSAVVGIQLMRAAGYSKGKSLAMGLIGGTPGAMLAVEVKARKTAKES
jgi:Flp pilus assembly protein TadB